MSAVEPLVSVIVAAYNAEQDIERALCSALGQTVADLEVIVVDDHSTDATVAKVAAIADARVHVHSMPDRRGPSACRNLALDRSTGRWAAVLDADDWWSLDRLEHLLDVAVSTGADVVCDDLYLVDERTGKPFSTYFTRRAARTGVTGVNRNPLGAFSEARPMTAREMILGDYGFLKPLLRSDFLKTHDVRYREDVPFAEDWALFVDCLVSGAKMVVSPYAGYYYSRPAGSLSRHPDLNWQFKDRLVQTLLEAHASRDGDAIRALNTRSRHVHAAGQAERVQAALRRRDYRQAAGIVLSNPRAIRVLGAALWARLRNGSVAAVSADGQ